jgi:opacity protein-like surface antigen
MKFIGSVLIFAALASSTFAEPIASSGMKYDGAEDHFQKGQWEGTVGAAVFFSPFAATKHRPTHDYALAVFDVGYMLCDVKEWGFARGNVEFLGELFGGGVFVGRGNYVSGFTLSGRYNFVQRDWKLVPYGQIGVGAGLTDIDKRVIGQVFQFNIDAAVGARYFIKPNLSLNAEYRYQHLSNANSGPKNIGVNAQGAMLGASWFF